MVDGPIDVAVIGFEGNQFHGDIIPALKEIVDRDIVRIIDLVFVSKDLDGSVIAVELEDAPAEIAELLSPVDEDDQGLLSEDDIAQIAEDLTEGCSAAMLVFEQTWLKPLREAVIGANGTMIAHERLTPEVVQDALESRRQAKQEAGA